MLCGFAEEMAPELNLNDEGPHKARKMEKRTQAETGIEATPPCPEEKASTEEPLGHAIT